jgi:hypothetical protein
MALSTGICKHHHHHQYWHYYYMLCDGYANRLMHQAEDLPV